MNRRFNSTGRIKISKGAIAIKLFDRGVSGPPRFIADLSSLVGLGLPSSAHVVVEAYHRQSSMRFDFGSIGNISPPSQTTLDEIDRGEVAQFRVKVVDTIVKPGRLLAIAEQLRPIDDDIDENRKAILPIVVTDLGEQLWRLSVSTQESPTLQLNRRVPDLKMQVLTDPLLRGVIFPFAIREILRVLLTADDMTDDTVWAPDWRSFGESLAKRSLAADNVDPEEVGDIIESVVEAFCNQQMWATQCGPSHEHDAADYE